MELTKIISSTISLLANSAIDIYSQAGYWRVIFFFLALIGLIALLSSTIGKIGEGISIVFKVFILLPVIFVVSFFNKKKRKERLEEWGEIKDNFKGKNIPKWKWWLYLLIKLGIPIIMILLAIFIFT